MAIFTSIKNVSRGILLLSVPKLKDIPYTSLATKFPYTKSQKMGIKDEIKFLYIYEGVLISP